MVGKREIVLTMVPVLAMAAEKLGRVQASGVGRVVRELVGEGGGGSSWRGWR